MILNILSQNKVEDLKGISKGRNSIHDIIFTALISNGSGCAFPGGGGHGNI